MVKKRGSVEVIEQIIKMGKRISIDEMAAAEKRAVSAGGRLASVAALDDDDWCGTGKFKFPIPFPKPDEFLSFLNYLAESRLNFEVLINGIPVPEEIIVGINRAMGR